MANTVTVDIPGIGQVIANNAASEATLIDILNTLKGTQKATNNLSKSLSGLGGAGGGGAGGASALGSALGGAGKAAFGLGKGLGMAVTKLNAVAFAASKVVGAFYDIGMGATKLVQGLANTGDSLTAAASSLEVIPVVGEGLSATLGAVAEAAEKVSAAYQSAASAGANFGGKMSVFGASASEAGMTIDKFGALIKSNGSGLLGLGSTVEEGAKRFGQVSKALRSTGSDLYALGYSTQDINEGLLRYSSLLRSQGLQGKMTNEQLAAGAKNYLKQMDALAKITGEERSAKEAQAAALAKDAQFQASMAGLNKEVRESFQNTVLGLPEPLQNFTKDVLANGVATTEANQLIMSQMPRSAAMLAEFQKKMQRGEAITIEERNRLNNLMKAEGTANLKNIKQAGAANAELAGVVNATAAASSLNVDAVLDAEKAQKTATSNSDKQNQQIEEAKAKIAELSNKFTMALVKPELINQLVQNYENLSKIGEKLGLPIFDMFTDILTKITNLLWDLVMPAVNALGNVLKSIIPTITEWTGKLFGFFKDFIAQFNKLLYDIIPSWFGWGKSDSKEADAKAAAAKKAEQDAAQARAQAAKETAAREAAAKADAEKRLLEEQKKAQAARAESEKKATEAREKEQAERARKAQEEAAKKQLEEQKKAEAAKQEAAKKAQQEEAKRQLEDKKQLEAAKTEEERKAIEKQQKEKAAQQAALAAEERKRAQEKAAADKAATDKAAADKAAADEKERQARVTAEKKAAEERKAREIAEVEARKKREQAEAEEKKRKEEEEQRKSATGTPAEPRWMPPIVVETKPGEDATKKAIEAAKKATGQAAPGASAATPSATARRNVSPAMRNLLETIAKGEGTSEGHTNLAKHGLTSGYDASYGYGAYGGGPSKAISTMTIAEVKQYQSRMLVDQRRRLAAEKDPEKRKKMAATISSAVGKYQFLGKTLGGLQETMGFKDTDIFTPELQDKMAIQLLKGRGLDKYLKDPSKHGESFFGGLSKEWASIANPTTGTGSYAYQHAPTSQASIRAAASGVLSEKKGDPEGVRRSMEAQAEEERKKKDEQKKKAAGSKKTSSATDYQEAPDSVTASLNSKMDQLIALTADLRNINSTQLAVQKSLSGDLYASV